MKLSAFLVGMVAVVLAVLPAEAAKAPSKKKAMQAGLPHAKKSDRSDLLFGTNAPIRTFKIDIASNELAALQKDNRSYVRATVSEGTNVFRDVGVHLKGNGSFQQLNQKPSFAVKFDRFVPDQEFLTLSKIMLNNSSQDGTYLAEMMATWMFRDARVPAPRVTHSRVIFNGRDVGLYVCMEAENKEFLKRWFADGKGNLYENYVQDVDAKMDQDNGDDTSQADVKQLAAVTKISDAAERWKKLGTVLDVDRYVSHLACEILTSHTDGYAMNRNNYRIYNNPETARFTFIGHGIDWGFANTGVSIQPPLNSLVTKAVLTTPEGALLYRQRLGTLFTNVFDLGVLTNRVNAAVARLTSQAKDANEANVFAGYGREMNNRLIARHLNVSNQLNTPPPVPLAFDQRGIAKLQGWTKKTDVGTPVQEETKAESKRVLKISSTNAACVASWRTRVRLAPGVYKFEGDARGAGITAGGSDPAGAGLRISGDKRENKVVGDSGWTRLKHDFKVEGIDRDVELVCELRADKGEVWFDANSLALVQVK